MKKLDEESRRNQGEMMTISKSIAKKPQNNGNKKKKKTATCKQPR